MGVEAGPPRAARPPTARASTRCWFATADPAYLDKTNATRHPRRAAARRRPVPRFDLGGAVRSGVGALRIALDGQRADARGQPPTCAPACRPAPTSRRRRRRRRVRRRRRRRRAGASPSTSARRSATEEFLDRWRAPGRSPLEGLGGAVRRDEVRAARRAGVERGARRRPGSTAGDEQVDRRGRAPDARPGGAARSAASSTACTWSTTSRRPSATPAPRSRRCCSPTLLEQAEPGQVDRARRARRRRRRAAVPHHRRDSASYRPPAPVATQVGGGRAARRTASSSSWRGMVTRRAAAPARARSASRRRRRAAPRTGSSAFVGSRDRDERRAAPPAGARLARRRRASTTWSRADGRRRRARSSRSPIDRSRTRRARRSCSRSSTSTAAAGSRSSSPTSTPTTLQIGDRVEMTFRRLFTADGIHDYFWKARPVRAGRRETDAHGFARDQGPGRDRRDGLHAVRRALGQGPRRPDRSTRPTRRSPPAGIDKDDVDAYWLGTAHGGHERHHARPPAAAATTSR